MRFDKVRTNGWDYHLKALEELEQSFIIIFVFRPFLGNQGYEQVYEDLISEQLI